MLRDARLIAAKDLRIEWSSRVLMAQVLPFGILVLILFGFGIEPEGRVTQGTELAASRPILEHIAPGLFWLAVVFSTMLALGRSFAIESADGNLDGLHMAGIEPSGIFLGKATAIAVELMVFELVVGMGAFVIYGPPLDNIALLAASTIAATIAIAAAGTLYGALGAGLRVRDTLVPLLTLPVLAPVLLGATRATESALFGPASDGWPWAGFLGAFALLYLAAGILSFGPLLEDT